MDVDNSAVAGDDAGTTGAARSTNATIGGAARPAVATNDILIKRDCRRTCHDQAIPAGSSSSVGNTDTTEKSAAVPAAPASHCSGDAQCRPDAAGHYQAVPAAAASSGEVRGVTTITPVSARGHRKERAQHTRASDHRAPAAGAATAAAVSTGPTIAAIASGRSDKRRRGAHISVGTATATSAIAVASTTGSSGSCPARPPSGARTISAGATGQAGATTASAAARWLPRVAGSGLGVVAAECPGTAAAPGHDGAGRAKHGETGGQKREASESG